MIKIICPRKGYKLAQEKDCECDTFKVYKNKIGEPIFECVKCGDRREWKDLINKS